MLSQTLTRIENKLASFPAAWWKCNLDVITSTVRLGWGENIYKRPCLLVVEMGFSPPPISLWVCSAVSAVGTQKRNSVKALLSGSLFLTACSHPPFPLHELTCWKKHMLLFLLPDRLCCLNRILPVERSSSLEREERLRKAQYILSKWGQLGRSFWLWIIWFSIVKLSVDTKYFFV